ncbi:DUF349 domain-containing protein [Microbacterium hibisci]|uniref:DUF349 domain-containing protein n=1 Tax=Microbacterium hibisci TaxID=2036000 RepID=UPI0027DA1416|nr:DUF349 domain-containing protein [Microbacterium hibisci]
MTAAADSQPETDAPDAFGSDDNQTPATPVDDDDSSAVEGTESAESADDASPVESADAEATEARTGAPGADAEATEAGTGADDAPAESPDAGTDEAPAEAPEAGADDAPAEAPEVAADDAEPAADSAEGVEVEVVEADVVEVIDESGVTAVEVVEIVVADAPSADEPWGRVDDDGTVSVREADGWRVVGQYPDGSPEEALAYFERKYTDLASEVTLLEVRHRRGGASASDLRSTARTVNGKLEGAAAVGDLASLVARVAALTKTLAAESETEALAAREAVDDAVKARTELVEKAEALAARDPRTVQWKQATAELNSLFDQWQSQQQNGPRLPKSTAQQLWKRFRDARATVDKHRRAFYAELDEAHKSVRDRKTRLVEKAEALASKGEDGIPAYRELLDQWKTAGRAGKKVDDALWARFKAAGDALYGARIEREAADAEASREKIDQKRALLEEAKVVADERDLAKARSILTGVQRRWDEIGRIFPRDTERSLDDELRRIETALRSREDADWKRNDPEQKARANDMTRQLTDAIQKLEDELEEAKKSGDKRAIAAASEALEARKSWLKALGG